MQTDTKDPETIHLILPDFPTHACTAKKSKKTGMPTYRKISMQSLFSRVMPHYVKKLFSETIKAYLMKTIPKFDGIPLDDYRLEFVYKICRNYSGIDYVNGVRTVKPASVNFDIDNFAATWNKRIIDTLRYKNYLEEDNARHFRKFSCELVIVETVEEQAIEVVIRPQSYIFLCD